jgi:hypothetical protein
MEIGLRVSSRRLLYKDLAFIGVRVQGLSAIMGYSNVTIE